MLSMRRALSLTAASNGLMRRCLLRWQDERLFPTFCVLRHLCHGFSSNERILLANSKPLSFSALILAQHKNDLTESSNSSGGGTDKAFYDKVF